MIQNVFRTNDRSFSFLKGGEERGLPSHRRRVQLRFRSQLLLHPDQVQRLGQAGERRHTPSQVALGMQGVQRRSLDGRGLPILQEPRLKMI
ncbi:hypothetical protein CDAR_11081 [Caerostris darwini]|uniref:Uncharacterized protein n=1 Tax=Caerostris darwini TaxID=1538125 RepID=A0AAV4VVJ6_9ARAC|nr:hypothetical protein CDAR_11081 [Caerostris darwini]